MRDFLLDVGRRWQGQRILVIAHSVNKWALDLLVNGRPLEESVDAPFNWQEGWEYSVDLAAIAAYSDGDQR